MNGGDLGSNLNQLAVDARKAVPHLVVNPVESKVDVVETKVDALAELVQSLIRPSSALHALRLVPT